MESPKRQFKSPRFVPSFIVALLTLVALLTVRLEVEGSSSSPLATYSHGSLHVSIPYRAPKAGSGHLVLEVLDPDDQVLGRTEKQLSVSAGQGRWKNEIKLEKSLPLEDLIWHRVRYRFEYDDKSHAALDGTQSISQIFQRPVVRVLGQQSYLSGSHAAVRLIVTDSNNQLISGRVAVNVDLLGPGGKPNHLFSGRMNQRGTTEAQFRFPAGLTGRYQLRYLADTPIGSTELTQPVHLEDKASILLTTEKSLYQPGQMIHVRALALDRSNHEASANRNLTFELEDSRGNKVFRRSTKTDQFGIASAEFGLADEVNLGTYHVRALMGDPDAPTNRAEISLNVERYVLPKFKVGVEFTEKGKKEKHGYQPGDHVTGTVHANYFFGKAVENGEITVRALALDVALFEATSVQGKTGPDGSYHFDLELPKYFVGRPLNHGAARVLVEASVKDRAGHTETKGAPVFVNEAPLMFTAIPEGGRLIPGLVNHVFVLASYADGTPAKADMDIRTPGEPDQHVATDDGGIAMIGVTPSGRSQSLQIEASDQQGDRASGEVKLEVRATEEQVLLRTERALYRAGDRIQLKIFSTRKHGTAYLDIVRDGQTLLTRDVDIENGQAELMLTATPEMTGTLDLGAYLFGSDAQQVADHRLIFVHPADELRIETVADAPLYKPGAEARVSFHVSNSRGEGVQAALGLQIVDEAVFALAEKQPGFAKVFFYLEQELMKPRYEIHALGMPEIVGPVPESQREQQDRAAQALFATTGMVSSEKFDVELGRDLPMTKYWEYNRRYRVRLQKQASRLAEDLNRTFKEDREDTDPLQVYAKLAAADAPGFRDAWGTKLVLEPAPWDPTKTNLIVHSAGPDRKLKTPDDLQVNLFIRRKRISSAPTPIDVRIEHNHGPSNGLADIVGTVLDRSGAVVAGAKVELRAVKSRKLDKTRTTASGQFSFSQVPVGDYMVQVVAPGFRIASQSIALKAQDRAVMSATLEIGETMETVEVTAEVPMLETAMAMRGVIGGVPGGVPGGQMGGVIGGLMATNSSVAVRSYFPESMYVNPEIITDGEGRASIAVPIADSITTWRMAMIASTRHGTLGTSTSALKVFQDFFVDLDVPATLTQGDSVSVPVAIYNYSGSGGEVILHLQPEDWFSLVDDVTEKSVALNSASVEGSQFTFRANRIGKYKLKLSAHMKNDPTRADIVVREVEVIPNGREQTIVFNGRLENAVEHQLAFPVGSVADASKIIVRLYPSPLSQIVEGMDSILQMPGGCFEQTSSTTYPNVLALDYMKRTNKLTPEVHTKAEGYIANGYQRLLTFEVPGGGFSWFGDAPANKVLTAYGLMEFHDMLKVYDVDPKLLHRTQQWLAGQQQSDGSWKPDAHNLHDGATDRYDSDVLRITAYIAWSLQNTEYKGPAIDRAIEFVEKHMKGATDAYTLALIANLAADYGRDREFIQHAVQQLLDARTEKDEKVWWTTDETGVYGTGASATVETTGLAVQALLRSGESSGVVRKALTYLVSKKDASGTWGTTQATIMALRALVTATEKGAADVRGTVTIVLNGKPAEALALEPENNDLYHQLVFKSVEQEKPNTIEIRFNGKGGLTYQVVGDYFLPWDQKPTAEPLSIDVSYDRTGLLQDDIATATATVTNHLDKTANMVIVDLGIPPGFELFNEDIQEYRDKSAGAKSGHLSKFSVTATQAILYFDFFAPGQTVNLKFRLRAKYPIRARTLKSRVYEYYAPELGSVAPPVQLEVCKR